MNGSVVLMTYQVLEPRDLKNDLMIDSLFFSGILLLNTHTDSSSLVLLLGIKRKVIKGIKINIENSEVKSFTIIKSFGKLWNNIVKTIIFKVGELNVTANAVSDFSPMALKPWVIGVAQLAHTPSGAPINAPNSARRNLFLIFGTLKKENKEIIKVEKIKPKVIPFQLVKYQFTVPAIILVMYVESSVVDQILSNEIPVRLFLVPINILLSRAG
jgi:hypothetical protein